MPRASPPQVLDVFGELACFTRPELKVERFSYPVITPSAARGIFESIYAKPREFRWQVLRIEVGRPIRYIALKRNEVKDKAPPERTIRQWMAGKESPEPLWADATKEDLGTDMKGRTQRQTMALRDVRYRLHAEIRPWAGFEDRLDALVAQFRRRAAQGKCVWQPCFGCREFPAYFDLAEPDSPFERTCADTIDLGLMLYDVFDLSRPGSSTDRPSVSVFDAKLQNGVLDVPPYESDLVLKPGRATPC